MAYTFSHRYLTLSGVAMIVSLLALSGCQEDASTAGDNTLKEANQNNVEKAQSNEQTSQFKEAPVQDKNAVIKVTGTIEYKTFEGGFYAFIADDGRHFTPMNLPKEYLQHGAKMTLTGKPQPDMMTTTQFGTVLDVISVSETDFSGASRSGLPTDT
ncbi:hypothetical protein [Alteromonas oceanisediminis]|uniref:hypothetical protein n=1 Tax=Alteromonas oceanisediminis TaxID=2836180 RepID=UPI001BDB22E5|nr:hypothetical protein [Alteromonas oceanisediminis]MBT0588181.1 hypothetical protein [Alteromonas oceanisediminis]